MSLRPGTWPSLLHSTNFLQSVQAACRPIQAWRLPRGMGPVPRLTASPTSVVVAASMAGVVEERARPSRLMAMHCTLSGSSRRNLSTWQSLVVQTGPGVLLSSSGTTW